MWQVLDGQIDWFCLQDGQYVNLLADEDGITRSRVFLVYGSIELLDRPSTHHEIIAFAIY